MAYRIISEKHSYILITGFYVRYALLETESEPIDNIKDKEFNLQFTNTQKLGIKKALKRGIYQELYNRAYLSSTHLNELIERNM